VWPPPIKRQTGYGGVGGVFVPVGVGGGEGVSLGGTDVPVAVGSNVEVDEAVSVGTGVTVANSILIGVSGGVLVATFGTHNLCPVNMVVEYPRQLACWSCDTVTR